MIKEEYKNLPEDEFIPLECVHEDLKGQYKINKLGEILTIKSGKIRKGTTSNGRLYPVVKLSNQSKSAGRTTLKSYYVHLLVANTFLVKPEGKTEVDHIDSDTTNARADNLMWVTRAENLAKTDRSKSNDNRTYKKFNKEGNLVGIVKFSDITPQDKEKIKPGRVIDGFIYKPGITTDLYDYLDYLGLNESDLDKMTFVKAAIIDNDNVLVSKYGIFKVNGKYTIGGKRPGGYRTITIGKSRSYPSHRVVYSTFSGETLTDADVIDHINTIPSDNQFNNLRKTDLKGNMNNPITLAKLRKPVCQYSLDGKLIREFNNSKEAIKSLGVTKDNSLKRCCLGKRVTWKGFIWIHKGDENTLLKDKLSKVKTSTVTSQVVYRNTPVKLFDIDGNLLGTFLDKSDVAEYTGVTEDYIKKVAFSKSITVINGKYLICYEGDEDLIKAKVEGLKNKIITKEDCITEAKKYNSRTEFLSKSRKYYTISSENGWLDEIFPPSIIIRRVKQYSLSGEYIQTFTSAKKAEKSLNIRNVSSVCQGKRTTSGGYLWCFEGEEDRIDVLKSKV